MLMPCNTQYEILVSLYMQSHCGNHTYLPFGCYVCLHMLRDYVGLLTEVYYSNKLMNLETSK